MAYGLTVGIGVTGRLTRLYDVLPATKEDNICLQRALFVSDIAISAILITLAILALYSTISIPQETAYAFIGVGAGLLAFDALVYLTFTCIYVYVRQKLEKPSAATPPSKVSES